jgi:hypothetical protein
MSLGQGEWLSPGLDHKEYKVQRDHRDHQDHQDSIPVAALKGIGVIKVIRETMDSQAHQDLEGIQVDVDLQVRQGRKVSRARRVLLEKEAPRESGVNRVFVVRGGKGVRRVRLARKVSGENRAQLA